VFCIEYYITGSGIIDCLCRIAREMNDIWYLIFGCLISDNQPEAELKNLFLTFKQ